MAVHYHFAMYGQSNSVGFEGEVPLSTSNVNENYNFTNAGAYALLVAPMNAYQDSVAGNVESPGAPIGNMLSRLLGDSPVSISSSGKGGAPYSEISKGNLPYQHLLDRVTDCVSREVALGNTVVVPCVFFLHGEAHANLWGVERNYYDALAEMQSDLSADILAITGQSQPVMLVYSSPAGRYVGWSAAGLLRVEQACVQAGRLNRNLFYIGSLDGYDMNPSMDAHHTNYGYRDLATTFAKVGAKIARKEFQDKPDFEITCRASFGQAILCFKQEIAEINLNEFRFFDALAARIPAISANLNGDRKSATFLFEERPMAWDFGVLKRGKLRTAQGFFYPKSSGYC